MSDTHHHAFLAAVLTGALVLGTSATAQTSDAELDALFADDAQSSQERPAEERPDGAAKESAASAPDQAQQAQDDSQTEPVATSTQLPAEPLPPAGQKQRRKRRIEEIIVTAQKREQSLQDVPMSITAVPGEVLEEMGAENFTDYADTVPSLNFNSRGEGQTRINLRGLQGIVGVPTVAWLVDGVEQALSASTSDPELFDIQRVEVLRGPQGTLYGAGAVGGAIKVVSNPPDPNGFSAALLGGYEENAAEGSSYKLNGMVNVPLIKNKLGARFVAFTRQQDGWIDLRQIDEPPQYNPDVVLAEDYNTVDVTGGRAALTWFVNDKLEISGRLWTQDTLTGGGPAISPSLEEEYGRYNFAEGSSPLSGFFTNNLYDQYSVDADWDLGFATLESVTGYAQVVQDTEVALFLFASTLVSPQSPELGDLLLNTPALDTGDQVYVPLINDYSIINQEIRLVSNSSGKLHWTVGLFYKAEDRFAHADTLLGQMRENIGPITLFTWSDQYAAYGEAEYAFTPSWSVLFGTRLFYEDLRWLADGDGDDEFEVDTNPSYFDWSPKLSLFHHFNDDILIYTTAAKGFRSGGVNVAESNPPPEGFQPSYDPDVLWSYEIGANTTLFDGRVVFNAAMFHADWRNLQQEVQVAQGDGRGTQRLVLNAGAAHSTGIEWEFTGYLTDRITLGFGGALLDSKLDEDLPNPNDPEDIVPAGTWLENVPQWSGNASLAYDQPVGSFLLNFTAAFTARDQSHGDILNSDKTWTEPHSALNLRTALMPASDLWNLTLYANNVLNSEKPTYAFHALDSLFLQTPRTIGLRMSYRFR